MVDGLTQNGYIKRCCLAFYKEKKILISILNDTSRMSVSIKFLSMVIESPSDLKSAVISFFVLFIFGLLACYITAEL